MIIHIIRRNRYITYCWYSNYLNIINMPSVNMIRVCSKCLPSKLKRLAHSCIKSFYSWVYIYSCATFSTNLIRQNSCPLLIITFISYSHPIIMTWWCRKPIERNFKPYQYVCCITHINFIRVHIMS